MRPTLSKFEIYQEHISQQDYFSGLVDERAMFEVFPEMIDYELLDATQRSIPAYARGNIIDKQGNLMRYFEKSAKVHNTNKRYIKWRLFTGPGDIRGTVVKETEVENPFPGLNSGTIELSLDVDWFGYKNVLIFEGYREMPLLVVEDPIPDERGYTYVLQILSDRDDMWLDKQFLEPGNRVIQIGSLSNEAEADRGPLHFGMGESYVEFEVPITSMAWEMEMTDRAHQASKNFRLRPVNDGERPEPVQHPDILLNEFEMKFMGAVNFQKDLYLTYGRQAGRFASKFLDRLTQTKLEAGPGFFEFLESSQVYDYPIEAGSLDIFINPLIAAWHDKVEPEMRNVRVATGSGGLIKWQAWCKQAEIDGYVQDATDYGYGDEEALFPGRKGVAINRKQYRAVYIEPFGKVTVDYLPFLDSDLVETRKYKGLPITSYQFIVTDFGYGEGDGSNVYVLRNPERNNYGYVIGTYSPLGSVLGNPGIANRFVQGYGKKNAFAYIHEDEIGFLIKDASYMMWFRPNLA